GAVWSRGWGPWGVGAAPLGPGKYGILPEKLKTAELPAGNALVEGATFLAILVGTIAGNVAVAATGSAEVVVGIILALALTSWSFARTIPAAGPAAPGLSITANPWVSTLGLVRELNADRRLWGGAHILSWVWLVRLWGAGAAADPHQDPGERKRGRGDHVPCRVHHRHCRWLGAGSAREPRSAKPGARAIGRGLDGPFRARHCLGRRRTHTRTPTHRT